MVGGLLFLNLIPNVDLTATATRTTLNLSRQGSRAPQLLEVGPNKLS
jgi:hypothetical protein